MRSLFPIALCWIIIIFSLPHNLVAKTPHVVATIPPLHALVASVMGDTGHTTLLVPHTVSPHHMALKPSDIKKIYDADILFYIDDTSLEVFLQRIFKNLPPSVKKIHMMNQPNIIHLPMRHGGAWEDAHHHDEPQQQKITHDPHMWLDPKNAIAMVQSIATTLASTYPEHATTYHTNAKELIQHIHELEITLSTNLNALKTIPFMVFHDAYQYLEHRYNLNNLGSITLDADLTPSLQRMRQLQNRLHHHHVRCVFREPQFSDQLITTLTEGSSSVKIVTLDPLGALDIGSSSNEHGYIVLMKQLAQQLTECLAPPIP